MNGRNKLVLIGNGMAGIRTLEHLLKLAPDKYEITVFGEEPHPNYNRIMLSSVLAGGTSVNDIILNDYAWYEENDIRLYTGDPVTEINTLKKTVTSSSGIIESYDQLIFATGSKAFILPLPGANKEGVIGFRNIKDCEMMLESSQKYKKAAVIGGGLLGLEAARGLLNLGMEVTVIHNSEYVMNRQLDEPASIMLRQELEQQGMKFLVNKHTKEVTGRKRVNGIRFSDGERMEVDLVVMAVGILPNILLAKETGLVTKRGIIVNDHMETSIKDVYAVGECAEHNGITYGLVAPLYEQGSVLAKHLSGVGHQGYHGSVTSTKLKVSGVDVFSAGDYLDSADTRSIRYQDEVEGVYKKIVVRGDRLVGAVLFGDTSDGPSLFSIIRSAESVTGREKEILLGMKMEGPSGGAKILEMSEDEIVCGCNGVTKKKIVDAIGQGCHSVAEVKNCTKASGSCGGCKPMVEQLLTAYAGEEAAIKSKEGICSCTSLDREGIITGIKEMGLKTVKEVMYVMGWNEPEGCTKCRPALNYYLGMIWPGEYVDEKESRYTNERYHANIQKDGTFSVVPRIYGGVTSPSELKKIAEVAEKYEVPMVKFTGGQRLDLLGVKKKDLPSMWEDLAMPSGHAYGKTLRTVKTCVGSTFCRFGTQDAIALGIRLEKAFERLNTPHKVKMAVSGCPRNCAESIIKDFGVVAIDGAWELYVGGNGGIKVRAGELLCTVKTEDEVIEWAGAFIQYYREQASWSERTSHWLDRVGLVSIKEALADSVFRSELVARLKETLEHTVDPWKEIVENKELRKNFEPLNRLELTHE
ncbi:nitrite reductase large subunit NirB [Paenibacillus sp. GYB006]|uniref:nitrite reductase large subunit NirB n=1 Tax=Paenibacillus sp. GYB006 TaxID=2994394 RepID=UPI002F968A91